MAHQDFNDDTKDAGEIGAGHHVTALYELVPPQAQLQAAESRAAARSTKSVQVAERPTESLTVKLRYKKPSEDTSRLIERKVIDQGLDFGHASGRPEIRRGRRRVRDAAPRLALQGKPDLRRVLEIAQPTLADDPSGYRREFVELVRKAFTCCVEPAGPAVRVDLEGAWHPRS